MHSISFSFHTVAVFFLWWWWGGTRRVKGAEGRKAYCVEEEGGVPMPRMRDAFPSPAPAFYPFAALFLHLPQKGRIHLLSLGIDNVWSTCGPSPAHSGQAAVARPVSLPRIQLKRMRLLNAKP